MSTRKSFAQVASEKTRLGVNLCREKVAELLTDPLNPYLEVAGEIGTLIGMTENAFRGGVITEEEHKDLRQKLHDAQMGNMFAAMAAYNGARL